MSQGFCIELWKERAWSRHKKALERGVPKKKAALQWSRDLSGINGLKTIIDWCNDRNVFIEFAKCRGGGYDEALGIITVSSRLTPEMQCYYLLHECGHFLIYSSSPKRFPSGYAQAYNSKMNRTLRHRSDVLEEEYEAWNRGLKLGRKLKIKIDKKRFINEKCNALMTYMAWALQLPKYKGKVYKDPAKSKAV
jgi:hypothetical protein